MRSNGLSPTLVALLFALAVVASVGAMGVAAQETTPNETVAGNDTAENATSDAFGQQVSTFVHSLQANDSTERPMGRLVASFVLENNPGAAMIPAHAGPPENATRGPPANATQGPPANVTTGPPANVTQGPPSNVTTGPPSNVSQGPPTEVGPAGNRTSDSTDSQESGPPADRGNGNAGGGSPADRGPR